jgi:hypothetical protein
MFGFAFRSASNFSSTDGSVRRTVNDWKPPARLKAGARTSTSPQTSLSKLLPSLVKIPTTFQL